MMINNIPIIPLIDLTSLNTLDTAASIAALIATANQGYNGLYPASICAYPIFAEQLVLSTRKNIKSCVVALSFPTSQLPLKLKLNEIAFLNQINIDEIDIVLPLGNFIAGKYDIIKTELEAIRNSTSKTIKLILETGLLQSENQIEKATILGINSGMNFIKTSTGKISKGADIESVKIIAETIKNRGNKTGLKIAGGISTIKKADEYIAICEAINGSDYISPKTFRIGTSKLYYELTSN